MTLPPLQQNKNANCTPSHTLQILRQISAGDLGPVSDERHTLFDVFSSERLSAYVYLIFLYCVPEILGVVCFTDYTTLNIFRWSVIFSITRNNNWNKTFEKILRTFFTGLIDKKMKSAASKDDETFAASKDEGTKVLK